MKERVSKKLLISIIAIVFILGTIVTMSVHAEETTNYTIKIKANDDEEHTYEAYQIFKGDLYEEDITEGEEKKTEKTLSNITWGSGIGDKSNELLNELKKDEKLKEDFKNCETARQVAEVLDQFNDEDEKLKIFAQIISKFLSGTKTTSTAEDKIYTISVDEPGYYFIKDKDDSLTEDKNSAYTRYMLKVVSNIEIEPKSEKPTVDKSLSPEDPSMNTTDHAINEQFNYYLTANLPENKEFSEYKKYKLVFEDTMSAGITYDGIESVKVKAKTTKEEAESDEIEIELNAENKDYEIKTATNEETGDTTLTITIDDLVAILKDKADITKGVKVVVTYKAHLNEKANASSNKDGEINNSNDNTVKLKYSNNPNIGKEESMGTTLGDTNYVFTYKIYNTKYSDSAVEGNELEGAEFKLYKKDNENEEEVKLIWDETLSAYRPINENADTEEEATNLKSQKDGKFDVKGLGAGTYVLKEVVTPYGYNTCEDITFEIKATFNEESGDKATVEFSEETVMSQQVVNVHGSKLPSTGSITLIIIIGLAVVFGIVGLVLSKDKKED